MRYAVLIAAALACGCGSSETPKQPIAFNHSLHAGKHAIDCTRCHKGARNGAGAGLPSIVDCLGCHMRAQGDEPTEKEATVRAIAAKGGPFRFVQVTRNDGHVYFSHRAHTTFAKMECEECHGQVKEWTEPPTEPNQDLVDMDACLDCHRERDAPLECKACHR